MTPREPDRFEEKARELQLRIAAADYFDELIRVLAAALRQAADEALERAAQAFAESPATQHSGAAVASVLRYLARDSAPQPAAAPAAEPERFFPGAAELMGNPPAELVAPSLLPRVLAFLEAIWRDHDSGRIADDAHTLAAELRRYIAEMEGKT